VHPDIGYQSGFESALPKGQPHRPWTEGLDTEPGMEPAAAVGSFAEARGRIAERRLPVLTGHWTVTRQKPLQWEEEIRIVSFVGRQFVSEREVALEVEILTWGELGGRPTRAVLEGPAT
jgi:hypothetical protein